ncbi:MAG: hypothetical protein JRI23_05615 [Deltaproteobacteria bacterium]|nr:hypothetical protein [Deltaproteobacteria bacterium]MBW2531039.1 hypothetical protein [Deltaproteobacteria bacterium]
MPTATAHARPRRLIAALLWAALTLVVGAARGGDKAMAESLFQAAKELMEAGRLDEACPKFAESMRVDPAVGSLLNLARCHQLQGKTATAWAEYLNAASMARAAGQLEREEGAARFASELEGHLSKLTIVAPHPVDGLEVRRGDVVVGGDALGVAVAVDPGRYVVEARAPGHRSWSTELTVGPSGDRQTVSVPELEPGADDDGAGGDGGSAEVAYYALAGVATGVGAAGIVVGAVFGAQASSRWDDAQAQCPAAPTYCDAAGVELSEEAHEAATISTVGFVIGGVGIAGAAVLWVLAAQASAADESDRPTANLVLAPRVSPGSVGLCAGGTF